MDEYLTRIIDGAIAKPPPPGMTTRVLAVDGLGGAGKTTLADRLARALGGAAVVHTDDFAGPDSPIDWWPRVIEEVLEPLARNESSRYRVSAWGEARPETWAEVAPARFVILEGVSASRDAFRPFLTYSVWIETPREVRLRRGLERDGESARPQWERWMEEEDRYVAQARPQEKADLVLPGDAGLWS